MSTIWYDITLLVDLNDFEYLSDISLGVQQEGAYDTQPRILRDPYAHIKTADIPTVWNRYLCFIWLRSTVVNELFSIFRDNIFIEFILFSDFFKDIKDISFTWQRKFLIWDCSKNNQKELRPDLSVQNENQSISCKNIWWNLQ